MTTTRTAALLARAEAIAPSPLSRRGTALVRRLAADTTAGRRPNLAPLRAHVARCEAAATRRG